MKKVVIFAFCFTCISVSTVSTRKKKQNKLQVKKTNTSKLSKLKRKKQPCQVVEKLLPSSTALEKAFIKAVIKKKKVLVRNLLANINTKKLLTKKTCYWAVCYTAKYGDASLFDSLISCFNLNQKSYSEAAYYAAKYNHPKILKRIFQKSKINNYFAALLFALLHSNDKCIDLIVNFLSKDIKFTQQQEQLLYKLKQQKQPLDIIESLINDDFFRNFVTQVIIGKVMCWAAHKGNLDDIDFLVQNQYTRTLITKDIVNQIIKIAANNGNKAIIQFLACNETTRKLIRFEGVDKVIKLLAMQKRFNDIRFFFEDPTLGRIIFENQLEEILVHNILPFIQDKDLGNIRATCKLFKKLSQKRWEEMRERKIVSLLEKYSGKKLTSCDCNSSFDAYGNTLSFTSYLSDPIIFVRKKAVSGKSSVTMFKYGDKVTFRENDTLGVILLRENSDIDNILSNPDRYLSQAFVFDTNDLFRYSRDFYGSLFADEVNVEAIKELASISLEVCEKTDSEGKKKCYLKCIFEFMKDAEEKRFKAFFPLPEGE